LSIKGTVLAAAVLALAMAAATNPEVFKPADQPHGSASSGRSVDIPADYLALYQSAPRCDGLTWQVLAAVGKVETNHGRLKLPGVLSGQNEAGAMGPMQFLAPTFRAVRNRHPEIGPNVYDPRQAIPAAARLLCDNGADRDLYRAIFSYNHADWYVKKVLKQSKEYS
jgi:membrane-bound lytic murein transglycosylase B